MLIQRVPWTSQPLAATPAEKSGALVDGLVDVLTANGGVFHGAAWAASNVALTYRVERLGLSGPAVVTSFDGSASYSELPVPVAAFGTGAFSVSLWIAVNSTTRVVIGNNRSGTASGWQIEVSAAGNLRINTAASFATTLSTSANLADNLPHFVTLTRTAAGVYTWFVDGVSDTTATTSAYNVNSGFAPLVGAQRTVTSPGNFFNGRLGFIALSRRAISLQEHAELRTNSWQLFEPRRIIVPVGAGGGATGSSSAQVDLSASSAGAVLVAGASAVTVNLAPTSAGAVAVAGASSAQIDLTGTATGTTGGASTASSDQTITLAGSSAGAVAVAGGSSGTIDLGASGTGSNGSGVAPTAGGDDNGPRPRRRKHLVLDGDRLLVFDSAAAAAAAQQSIDAARARAQQAIAKAASKSQARKATKRRAEAVTQAIQGLQMLPEGVASIQGVQTWATGLEHLQATLTAAKAASDAQTLYAVWQAIQQDEEDIAALMELV